MATVTNKQQLATQTFNLLKKQYDPPDTVTRPVLEQLLYAVCREGTSRDQADQAFQKLSDHFFDWNEVRVSTPQEVASTLSELPEALRRAEHIIELLQNVFETEFSYDLESLDKKGLKQAAKHLARYNANDYAIAWVLQQALGGHAIPLDEPTLRVLRRLGLLESEGSLEALRASIEHLIPKARGPAFNEMVSLLARDVCWEDAPNCAACPLRSECPTGQDRLDRNGSTETRAGRPKPR